ncbi:MAG TPA: sulfatase [Thermoanaerobaculia bacterium]|jgi:arylsulfatase A-like enzyme
MTTAVRHHVRFLAVGVLVSLAACGQAPGSAAWTRADLCKLRSRESGLETRWVRLGEGVAGTRRHRLAGEIRALVGVAGRDYAWSLDLGDEPYLSFVPAGRDALGCRLAYAVRIVDAGGTVEIHRQPIAAPEPFAPPPVEVPLDAFARRRVRLVLRVDAEGPGCDAAEALWGNPAVYSRGAAEPTPGDGRPHVVLLGLDTVRADAVGAYGGQQTSPTPAIDRLAAESDVWLEAYSPFNVTNPSFASVLTGLYGKRHGVYDLRTPLAADRTTLAELFRDAGYDTAAIVAARHLGGRQSGLAQGFESYQVPPRESAAEAVVDEAIDWISRRRRPFFLWLHLFDPHTPHTPPRPFALGWRPARPGLGPVGAWTPFRRPGAVAYDHRTLGGHRDLYAGEIAYLDRHVGRLLDFLASRALLERSVVALVADHGENLGEHGVSYRHTGLWDTTTHVPLTIRWPELSPPIPPEGAGREGRGRRLPGLVQTLDLFPTLLAAAGLAAPPSDGVDLRRRERRPAVFAEASRGQGAMVRTPRHLLFWAFEEQMTLAAGRYLFDLERDPAQETNVAGTALAVEEELMATLERWLADRRTDLPPPAPLSEDEIERLRALGYVDGR